MSEDFNSRSTLSEDGYPQILDVDCVHPNNGVEEFLCVICECVAFDP
jgi:hypothetical protein